jgi:L-rhamnose-H+ transport protein
MQQSIFPGLSLIAAGAFSSGSFAMPFGKIKDWEWESYWLIFSIGAYLIFPLASCLLFSHGFIEVINAVPVKTLCFVFLLGAVYGIGNLSFGLSLRYLGLSLGYALSLGLMLAIGTLIPPLFDGRLKIMMKGTGGTWLIIGVIIALLGIAMTGWAGYLKDRKISESEKKVSISEFNFIKGIIAAILVGITGSAMSLGFEQGIPIAEMARKAGIDPLFMTLPVMLVLLSGTFITTLIWCIYLGLKNQSLKNYVKSQVPGKLITNYLFALFAGFLWFIQFILFGMGKSKMGPFTFTSWGILMGLTIVFATLWGLYRKEWKGAPVKVYSIMLVSLIIIICSAYIIGISGSM